MPLGLHPSVWGVLRWCKRFRFPVPPVVGEAGIGMCPGYNMHFLGIKKYFFRYFQCSYVMLLPYTL